jgi:DNA-binding SARP family transcriptional activator
LREYVGRHADFEGVVPEIWQERRDVSTASAADTLRVELLGGFRIAFGANELPAEGWRLAKARSLVKIIALAPDQSIHREQVIELLWPELDPDSGSNNLHQALHVARRSLGALMPEAQPTRILRLERGVLRLTPPVPLWIDVDAFEQSVNGLTDASDLSAYYAALDLYRGDLLPDDLYEDWTYERRAALREQYLNLLDRLARLHQERREPTPAIDALRRIVAIEPDQEEAHRALMELYALTGRRQQALRQYERLRDILEHDLEMEPEPATDELHQAILSGEFPAESWVEEPSERSTTAPRPKIAEPITAFLSRGGDFVGREHELAVLQRALERVIGGRGEIILIGGEPGIGKTRMAEEFLRYAAAQGVRTLNGRSYDGDGAPAYWPWVQIVRSYVEGRSTAELQAVIGSGAADIARIAPELRERLPDLEQPPPLDPDGERFRLFDSMTTFLKNAAARSPLALILDDLHSADRSSLLLLEFLAKEISSTGLLIIGTYRHLEVDRSHALTHALGQLTRYDVAERITLDGLTPDDIAFYIEQVTGRPAPDGLAGAIHDQSEGNPFFVREIVRLLIEEQRLDNPEDVRSWHLTIPHGIRETIALRIAQLGDTAHRVLTTASVAGRDFDLSVVAGVAGLDELEALAALEEAIGTGLIAETPHEPGGFRFAHAITRRTIYDDLSHARRLRLHLRTGQVIEQMPPPAPDERLPELAYHFAAAASLGVADRAIDYLRRASAQATERVAYAEAADYLRRAVDLYAGHFSAADETFCELYLLLGDALTNAGEPTEAQIAYERAATIARALEDGRRLARAAIGIFEAGFYSAYWYQPFVDVLDEALAGLTENDWDLRIRVLSRLATAVQDTSDGIQRMWRLSEEAVDLALRHDEHRELPFALYARLVARWAPEIYEVRLRDATELVEAAERVGDTRLTLIGRACRIHYFIENGAIVDADAEIERYATLARASRQPHYLWADHLRRTMRLIVEGRFAEAERDAHETLNFGMRAWPDPARANYYQQMFMIRREQDRLAEIESDVAGLVSQYPGLPLWRCLLSLIHLETDREDEARATFDDLAEDRFGSLPRDWFWLANLALLSEACLAFDDTDAASDLYELLEPYDGRLISPGTDAICLGPVSYYLGLLAATVNDRPRALNHFRDSAMLARSLGFWPWFGYSYLRYAEFGSGHAASEANDREMLKRARDLAQRLGMPRLLRLTNRVSSERTSAM